MKSCFSCGDFQAMHVWMTCSGAYAYPLTSFPHYACDDGCPCNRTNFMHAIKPTSCMRCTDFMHAMLVICGNGSLPSTRHRSATWRLGLLSNPDSIWSFAAGVPKARRSPVIHSVECTTVTKPNYLRAFAIDNRLLLSNKTCPNPWNLLFDWSLSWKFTFRGLQSQYLLLLSSTSSPG